MTSNRMSDGDARFIKPRTASSTARSMEDAACSMARFNSPARASATGLTFSRLSLSKGDATLSNNSKVLTTTNGGASLEFKSSIAVARAWASRTCAEHQNRKRNDPRRRVVDTSPSNKVKTPQHLKTPRYARAGDPQLRPTRGPVPVVQNTTSTRTSERTGAKASSRSYPRGRRRPSRHLFGTSSS